MSNRDDEKLTNFIAVLIVVVVILLIGGIARSASEKKCARSGCDSTVSGDGNYCYIHSSTVSTRKTSSYSGYSSSTKKSTPTPKPSSGKKKSTYSSFSKKSSSSSMKSYDEGYDAIYEDDDYDWDRYWRDSDYASGVDDAMEDMDW